MLSIRGFLGGIGFFTPKMGVSETKDVQHKIPGKKGRSNDLDSVFLFLGLLSVSVLEPEPGIRMRKDRKR